jgi:hypothetical protein
MTESRAVVALAGRRIDADGAVERFPLRNRNQVRGLIREAIREADAAAIISSGACGADLLALDAAGELGIRRRVILPFDTATFRRLSVVDRSGGWGSLFDRILPEVERAGDLLLLGLSASEQSAYEETNRAILSEGEALAAQIDAAARVAVIVWDCKPRGADDVTWQFLQEAVGRGWSVREVSTLTDAR